jgi:hypothetical protein
VVDDADLLWHYTNAQGLYEIVTSKTLVASDYRFLNDSQEVDFGLDIAETLVDELEQAHLAKFPGNARDAIDAARKFPNIGVLVASLSADGDLLSQWRAYGAPQPYALGFRRELLQKRSPGARATLEPALVQLRYGGDAARDVLRD